MNDRCDVCDTYERENCMWTDDDRLCWCGCHDEPYDDETNAEGLTRYDPDDANDPGIPKPGM